MTREQLIKKHSELFINIIKEGIELALYGYTEIINVKDVEKFNEEIKKKIELWDERAKNEEEYLQLI